MNARNERGGGRRGSRGHLLKILVGLLVVLVVVAVTAWFLFAFAMTHGQPGGPGRQRAGGERCDGHSGGRVGGALSRGALVRLRPAPYESMSAIDRKYDRRARYRKKALFVTLLLCGAAKVQVKRTPNRGGRGPKRGHG